MKDIFGFELSVGDTVAFGEPAASRLVTGVIKSIDTYTLYIKFPHGYTNKYPGEVAKRVLEPADLKLLKFTLGSDQ